MSTLRSLAGLSLLLAVLPAFTAAAADASVARVVDPPPVTIQLFNGRNLDGLEVYTEKPLSDPATNWKVVNGVLMCSGSPRGYLRTKMGYADYRLHVEWRWPVGVTKGNSGVILHIVNRDEIWPKAFEANLAAGHAGDINNFVDARSKEEVLGRTPTGFSTGRVTRPAAESAERPLGEWNAFDIIAAGATLTLIVNGVEVNRVTDVTPSAGMIGLQSEGSAVEFRNITLTPLPPAKDMHVPRAESP